MKKTVTLFIILISSCVAFAQVTIKGKMERERDSVISFFRNRHPITGERDGIRYNAEVGEDGHFEVTLPEENIGQWLVEGKDRFQVLHLMKGRTYELHDSKDKNHFSAIGENADDFNYLSYYRRRLDTAFFKGDDYQKRLQTKNLDSALLLRKRMADYENEVLTAYRGTHSMSDTYYRWLKTKYHYTPYERSFVENLDQKAFVDSTVIKLLVQNGTDDDYAALNTEEYIVLIYKYYLHYKYNKMTYPMKIAKLFDFAMGNTLKGLTKEVALTRWLMLLSKSPDSVYTPLYKKYSVTVQNKQLKDYIDIARNTYLEDIAYANQSKENISQNASLHEIFKKYKGKVVYIDFWASWCGPCISEMRNAAALRKKLEGKEVIFVYLGYKDQKANWLGAREKYKIEGEHYLLSDQLVKEANQLFRITGIPHYAVLDKQGNIQSKKADRPLPAYEQLLKLAEDK